MNYISILILLLTNIITASSCSHLVIPDEFKDSKSWTYEKKTWVQKNNWERIEQQYYISYKFYNSATEIGFTARQLASIYKSIDIEWRPDSWECSRNPDGMCDMDILYDKSKYMILLKTAPCMPLTEFSHAIMHIFHHEVSGDMDWKHSNNKLYSDVKPDMYHTAQWMANTQGVAFGMCENVHEHE